MAHAALLAGTLLLMSVVPASAAGAHRRGDIDLPRLRRIIATPEATARYVDPARGLVLILHHTSAAGADPRAGADGMVRVAERLCGARLQTEIVALRRALATRLDRRPDDGGIICQGRTCRFGAAPAPAGLARAGAVTFRPGGTEGLLLDTVIMREPASDPAGEAAASRWIAERARSLAGGRCDTDGK